MSEMPFLCKSIADIGDHHSGIAAILPRMTTTTSEKMTGDEMVDLCRRHSIFEWSAQAAVDPIPVAHAKGIYFWTPEGKRFIDFNSQLMCVNIGHGDERVINAIKEQASTLPTNPRPLKFALGWEQNR
jgi:4-aminobutyrate aminotransferase-like enzyme